MSPKSWLVLLIPAMILLIGCGSAPGVGGTSTGLEPTLLRVQRINLIPANHYRPFANRTISDQHSVLHLYQTIQALPVFPPGIRSCPADLGLTYQLDFFQGSQLLQTVTIDMGGCQTVHWGKQEARLYDQTFLRLLTQTLGVSASELEPMPLSSCTPHSPCPSPTP